MYDPIDAMVDAMAAEHDDRVTARVLDDVAEERVRQDAEWGQQNHEPGVWLAILSEEVGELATTIVRHECGGDNHRQTASMREEAIHVAAVAVQIVEWLDRQG